MKKIQFTIGALLVFIAIVAAYFGGYRAGYVAGQSLDGWTAYPPLTAPPTSGHPASGSLAPGPHSPPSP